MSILQKSLEYNDKDKKQRLGLKKLIAPEQILKNIKNISDGELEIIVEQDVFKFVINLEGKITNKNINLYMRAIQKMEYIFNLTLYFEENINKNRREEFIRCLSKKIVEEKYTLHLLADYNYILNIPFPNKCNSLDLIIYDNAIISDNIERLFLCQNLKSLYISGKIIGLDLKFFPNLNNIKTSNGCKILISDDHDNIESIDTSVLIVIKDIVYCKKLTKLILTADQVGFPKKNYSYDDLINNNTMNAPELKKIVIKNGPKYNFIPYFTYLLDIDINVDSRDDVILFGEQMGRNIQNFNKITFIYHLAKHGPFSTGMYDDFYNLISNLEGITKLPDIYFVFDNRKTLKGFIRFNFDNISFTNQIKNKISVNIILDKSMSKDFIESDIYIYGKINIPYLTIQNCIPVLGDDLKIVDGQVIYSEGAEGDDLENQKNNSIYIDTSCFREMNEIKIISTDPKNSLYTIIFKSKCIYIPIKNKEKNIIAYYNSYHECYKLSSDTHIDTPIKFTFEEKLLDYNIRIFSMLPKFPIFESKKIAYSFFKNMIFIKNNDLLVENDIIIDESFSLLNINNIGVKKLIINELPHNLTRFDDGYYYKCVYDIKITKLPNFLSFFSSILPSNKCKKYINISNFNKFMNNFLIESFEGKLNITEIGEHMQELCVKNCENLFGKIYLTINDKKTKLKITISNCPNLEGEIEIKRSHFVEISIQNCPKIKIIYL